MGGQSAALTNKNSRCGTRHLSDDHVCIFDCVFFFSQWVQSDSCKPYIGNVLTCLIILLILHNVEAFFFRLSFFTHYLYFNVYPCVFLQFNITCFAAFMVPTGSDESKLRTFQGPFQDQISHFKDFYGEFHNADISTTSHIYVLTFCFLAFGTSHLT